MRRLIQLITGICVCICILNTMEQSLNAKERIQYSLAENGIITFSGKGTLTYYDHRSLAWEEKEKIKKIVISEGITELEEQALAGFSNAESIVFPDSLTKIGTECFSNCYLLEKIAFGKNIREIGESAFSGCVALEHLRIPDGVTKIGAYAFYDCKMLKELILPASLKSWKKSAVQHCPQLKRVVNRSKISCEIDTYKGLRIWRAGGRKISVVPKGKTALARGKMIPITYKLKGGKKKGKLPDVYEFGTRLKIPLNVTKKGYAAVAWYCQGTDSNSDMTFYVGPEAKKVILTPYWYKYKIENKENGAVHAHIEIENKDWAYDRYEIRYSESANMKNSKITTLFLNKGNVSKKITGLKKGKTYYFQFRAYVDAESGAGCWVGKRKVKIVR